MTRGTKASMAKTVVLVTVLATLVFALLGGLAGQAWADEPGTDINVHITCGDLHTYTRKLTDGTTINHKYYSAWLGYTNTSEEGKTFPAGTQYNYFNPGALNRGQPSDFSPGRYDYSLFVVNDEHYSSKLFWVIDGGYLTINSGLSSQRGIPSCQGEGPAAPAATTSPASGLGPTGATLNAAVDPNGVDTTYRFEYGTDTTYGSSAPAQDGSVAASGGAQLVSATLDGLQPSTTYHYRVVATNKLGTRSGEDRTFTTPEQPVPNVDVSLSQTATPGRAALGQKITYALTATNRGADTATGVRAVASLPDGAGFVAAESSPGCSESAGVVTCQAGTLGGGQSAAFNVVLAPSVPGVLANGAAVAADQPDPNPLNNSAIARATLVAPPQATTSPAGDLTPTTATLNALVDPNGEDATYRFEYAKEAAYDANAPDPYARGGKTAEGAIAGGEARTVHHELTGLRPNTTYHYRVVATNGLGATAAGADRTFTTPAEPPPSNVAPTIQAISPTRGSEIQDRTPTVRAKVTDSGTDLRKDDIRLWVDGKMVERFSYDRARDRLSYETPKLGYGRHTVLIVARDEQRLSSSRFWGFRVVKR